MLITGMIGYALQHPRAAVAPIIETVGTTTPSEPGSPTDTETTGVFTLRLNETGESHGWSVTPVELLEDSRCPADVECIRAGTVRVSVRVGVVGTPAQSLTFLEPVLIEGGRITLLKVDPTVMYGVPKQKSDYRFTFLVEEL